MTSKIFCKCFLLLLFLNFTNPLRAQTSRSETIYVDSLYQIARALAFSGKGIEARTLARKIMRLSPKHLDARTLVGRTYAWDGHYDSARSELKQALSISPLNEDATSALIDVELWSNNFQAALDICNNALKNVKPGSKDFLFKKERALAKLNNTSEVAKAFNVDSAFQTIKMLAFSGKTNEARALARKVLEVKPAYTDMQTLIGRTYAWEAKYDSARIELKQALSLANKNEDATNALIDLELWAHNFQAALDISNNALKDINPLSKDFEFKKTRAFNNLNNKRETFNITDTDTTFQKIRILAYSGKRIEARALARNLLAEKPNSADVQILLARTYSWDGKYDSARIQLKEALTYTQKNEDANNALIDVELWSNNYQPALDICNYGLKNINPVSEDFLFKKAQALHSLNRLKESSSTLQQLLQVNPKHEKGLNASRVVRREQMHNKLGISYDYDGFSTSFSPWHNVSVTYTRQSQRFGSIIGRINYANRFEKNGVQYEIDMYPRISKKVTSYVNFGYSFDNIFPTYRWGFSLYRGLSKGFEGEIGMRYLKFQKPATIYTALLGKYLGNFLFSFRTYIVPKTIGYSKSFVFITRYYLNEPDLVKRPTNYMTLTLGKGFAPDEFLRDITLIKTDYLNSQRVRFAFQRRYWERFTLSAAIGYGKDEFRQNSYRENYNFSLGVEMFF